MEKETGVQIMDEDVYVSLNAFRKDVDLSLLLPAIGK